MELDGSGAWSGRTRLSEGQAGASQFMIGGLRRRSGKARSWTRKYNELQSRPDGDRPKPLGI